MKIIQFGEGNFLRAFVEWIAQQMNYSVAIVKPRPGNTLDALRAQGCRYHVNLQGLLNGKTIDTMEEITCVTTAVNPYEDHETFLALAEDAEARFIVSNTTEAGIVHDTESAFDQTPPVSFPAKLTRVLYERFAAGKTGVVILSCELIDNNGKELLKCVNQYIDDWKLARDRARICRHAHSG